MKQIAAFGASSSRLEQRYYDAAYRIGALLAENGLGLVFGAGDKGLMGSIGRGAHEAGGRVTGVLPRAMDLPGVAYACCDELIITDTMHERKATIERLSDGYIVLPGGYGTLEETMEVLTFNQLGYLSAPVVIFNQDGFYEPLLRQLALFAEQGFTHPAFLSLFRAASTPEQALAALLSYQKIELPDKLADETRHRA